MGVTRDDMAKIFAQCETNELDEFIVVPETYDFLTRGIYQTSDDDTRTVWEHILENPVDFSKDILVQCMSLATAKVYGPTDLKTGEFMRLVGAMFDHVCSQWKGKIFEMVDRIRNGENVESVVDDVIDTLDPWILCQWLNRCPEEQIRRKVYRIYLGSQQERE